MEEIILVDEHDNAIGTAEKLAVHRKGLLHRAFSVFIFSGQGEVLLQQRALHKYHSGGLWTNTCCGHPRPGEDTAEAARRRLGEEMGIDCGLKEEFSFTYRTELQDMVEHELDHVFTGTWYGVPDPDPEEVMDWQWAVPEMLLENIKAFPERYTYWFRELAERVFSRKD